MSRRRVPRRTGARWNGRHRIVSEDLDMLLGVQRNLECRRLRPRAAVAAPMSTRCGRSRTWWSASLGGRAVAHGGRMMAAAPRRHHHRRRPQRPGLRQLPGPAWAEAAGAGAARRHRRGGGDGGDRTRLPRLDLLVPDEHIAPAHRRRPPARSGTGSRSCRARTCSRRWTMAATSSSRTTWPAPRRASPASAGATPTSIPSSTAI